MPAIAKFVADLLRSELLGPEQGQELLRLKDNATNPRELAKQLLRLGWLTPYQINQVFRGDGAGLTIGPYLVLERIGEGGMGQVFKAKQKVLNRTVALKVIRKACLGNPKVILRFQREILAAGQLNHPHIVRAYDADQINGSYYIAMEYIDGSDLDQLVKRHGPLPVDQACEYIRQAALGLQHASERGMVHRDIKPANLLVTKAVSSDRRRSSGLTPRPREFTDKRSGMIGRCAATQHYPWGVVKILDLGLARCDDPLRDAPHLTQVGSLMGTPEYIAPEQVRDSHTSDIRADLYSLGCTLYFLLTGQPPFPDGTVTEKLLQQQFDIPDPVGAVRRDALLARQGNGGPAALDENLTHVPPAVERILCRLLAKDPAERHQTPLELANDLQAILTQMADGTLPRECPASLPAPIARAVPSDPTVIEPIILLTPRGKRRNEPLPHVYLMAAAGASGLAFAMLLSVIGVLLAMWTR